MNAHQRGVAIVLAMGVVALAALAATAMMASQGAWSRQVELISGHAQAQILLRTGLDWACALLYDDRRASSVDHADEPWAMRLPPIPVENGTLVGRIEDQQGKFNLNNLLKDGKADPRQLAHFRRLLAALSLSTGLADALIDWIDTDGEPQPADGAEDETYLALQPAYRAPNRPLVDVAELALVHGFDSRTRDRLRPFVSALPGVTPVNVNTASPEVLSSLVEGMDIDAARAVVARRDRGHFLSVTGFLAQLPDGLGATTGDFSVGSAYFLASMQADIGGAQAFGSALLARTGTGWPAVIWRKYP